MFSLHQSGAQSSQIKIAMKSNNNLGYKISDNFRFKIVADENAHIHIATSCMHREIVIRRDSCSKYIEIVIRRDSCSKYIEIVIHRDSSNIHKEFEVVQTSLNHFFPLQIATSVYFFLS